MITGQKYSITPKIGEWNSLYGTWTYTAPELRNKILLKDGWYNNYVKSYHYVLNEIVKAVLDKDYTEQINELIKKTVSL